MGPVEAGPARVAAEPTRRVDRMGRDYWVVAPPLREDRTRWLVVLAHGFQGRGQDILWLRRAFRSFDDCVFVAPSFLEGYQELRARAGEQLLAVVGELRQRFRLHAKFFVCGFSGGAQFSHRFAMAHPDAVIGCGAHAGGSWGPAIEPGARSIPMAVSCGLDDAARSSLGQEWTRVQAAHRYFRRLTAAGMWIKPRLWSRLGHATSPAVEAHFAECFQLATRGLYPAQARALQEVIERLEAGEADHTARGLRAGAYPAPGPKPVRRAISSSTDRRRHAVLFEIEGLGGKSVLGPAFWVDDTRENEAGWSASPAAEKARQMRLRKHLAGIRERFRRVARPRRKKAP